MSRTLLRRLRCLPADVAILSRTRGWRSVKALGPQARLYRRSHVLVIEQRLDKLHHVPPPEGVVIESFDGDWSRLSRIVPSKLLEAFVRQDAAGRACLTASRQGVIVGYTWISEEMDPDIEHLPLALPADAAYLWALLVVRSERGSGIGSALTSARLEFVRDKGFRVGWRAISPTNRPSLRTAEKTGDVRVLGELRRLRIFGYRSVQATKYGEQSFLSTQGS